jgi:hypothetical protein
MATLTWVGLISRWFDPTQWTSNLGANSYPLSGDTVVINSGTVEVPGSDALIAGRGAVFRFRRRERRNSRRGGCVARPGRQHHRRRSLPLRNRAVLLDGRPRLEGGGVGHDHRVRQDEGVAGLNWPPPAEPDAPSKSRSCAAGPGLQGRVRARSALCGSGAVSRSRRAVPATSGDRTGPHLGRAGLCSVARIRAAGRNRSRADCTACW